jgi:hypothetical protein
MMKAHPELLIPTHVDLMKAYPELMMPALLAHNNFIQKAKLANFGHTVVQDGGTFEYQIML